MSVVHSDLHSEIFLKKNRHCTVTYTVKILGHWLHEANSQKKKITDILHEPHLKLFFKQKSMPLHYAAAQNAWNLVAHVAWCPRAPVSVFFLFDIGQGGGFISSSRRVLNMSYMFLINWTLVAHVVQNKICPRAPMPVVSLEYNAFSRYFGIHCFFCSECLFFLIKNVEKHFYFAFFQ